MGSQGTNWDRMAMRINSPLPHLRRTVWTATAKKAASPVQDTKGLLKEAKRLFIPGTSRSR